MAQLVFAPFLMGIMEVGATPRRPSSSSTAAGAHSVAFRAPSGLQCSKVAERPRGTWPCNEFHWSLHNFNRPQKTSQGMDDEPRVRRQRTGLLVGCATRPMSELHWYPHGRLRKLKNRLKTSRSAREPHRAATSLAMAQAAPALGEALQRGSAARSPPRPPSRYFGEPMVDMFRPWVRSTVAALKGTCVQPSALQPMGSRSLFSTAKATKMIMVVVVLEGFCSFLTTPRQRPRARSSPRPDSVAANSVAPPDSVADVTARMRAMAYVSSLLVRIAPAWRRKLTSNMLLLVISRSFSNRLLVVTATKSRREETEDNEHRRIMRLPTLGTRKSSS